MVGGQGITGLAYGMERNQTVGNQHRFAVSYTSGLDGSDGGTAQALGLASAAADVAPVAATDKTTTKLFGALDLPPAAPDKTTTKLFGAAVTVTSEVGQRIR